MRRREKWLYSIPVLVASLFTVYPLVFMIMSSLKTNKELFNNYWGWPSVFHIEHFREAWVDGKISTYALNSLIVTIAATLIAVTMASLLAYAIAKMRFRGADLIMGFILLTIFIPDEMNLVSKFLLVKNLGLLGTHWNLIIVYATGSLAASTYILRNYIVSIPKELGEAAEIDGSGEWGIFLRIYLPLILPATLSVIILIINGIWGEYTWALVSVSDDKMRTLPVGLTVFQSLHGSNYGPLMAGLCIMVLPIITLFIIFTKQFTNGLTQGTLKE